MYTLEALTRLTNGLVVEQVLHLHGRESVTPVVAVGGGTVSHVRNSQYIYILVSTACTCIHPAAIYVKMPHRFIDYICLYHSAWAD